MDTAFVTEHIISIYRTISKGHTHFCSWFGRTDGYYVAFVTLPSKMIKKKHDISYSVFLLTSI